MTQIVLNEKPHHQPGGMPTAGYDPSERCFIGSFHISVKALRIKPVRECKHLVELDRYAAKPMNLSLNVILEIAIVDRG
jgi:hypothetical protein